MIREGEGKECVGEESAERCGAGGSEGGDKGSNGGGDAVTNELFASRCGDGKDHAVVGVLVVGSGPCCTG